MKKLFSFLIFAPTLAWGTFIPGPLPDSSTFTLGTTPAMPMAGTYDQFPTPVQSTTTAALRMTPLRSLLITPVDYSGVPLGTATTNPFFTQVQGLNSVSTVTVSGTVNAITTGTVSVSFTNPTTNIVSTGALIVSLTTTSVSGTVNIITTGALTVSLTTTSVSGTVNVITTGSMIVSLSTVQVVNTTVAVTNAGQTALTVSLSTVQVVGTTIAVTNAGQSALTVSLSTVQVVNTTSVVIGMSGVGVAIAGNPVPEGLLVTSTTLPTTRADGTVVYGAASNIGAQIVGGIPWGLLNSTYSATISSSIISGGSVQALVSSATAGNYTYLCGCVFTNTTATNGDVILESPYGVANAINGAGGRMTIGVPANHVPTGVFPGPVCSPFYRSAVASNIYIYQNIASSTQNVYMRCVYWQGP